jgi:predicted acetyltransferase
MHEIRTVTEDEVGAFWAAMATGFMNPSGDRDAEARRPGMDLDRTYAAFDGSRIVATLRSFPTELTLPGGGATVAASAVTAVTTTATHRRRGLATRLVDRELAASVDRGEPVSVLIALEWPIYGRFGYGAATEHQTWTVDTKRVRLRDRPRGTVEFVGRDEARALMPVLYEKHRLATPGEIGRTDRYWDLDHGIVRIPSWGDPKPAFHVVARDPAGEVVGAARYLFESRWSDRQPVGTVELQTMFTTGPLGDALIWEHLFSLDLAGTVRAGDRPVDDLLPWLLVDARHARAGERFDALWARPLDVPALLGARTYGVPGKLVLEVVDGAGYASGRFALDGGPFGATCVPTTESADLTIGVSALGSVLLGGHPVRTLAAAGLVDEHAPGAVARATRMFTGDRAPWCTTWF